VLFLPADGAAAATTPARVNGASRESLVTSATPDAVTPQRSLNEPSGPVSRPEERPAGSKHLGEIKDEVYSPATSGGVGATVSAAAARVSNAIPMSQEDLRVQLEEAKATISRLTAQASEATGLRQRKTESTPQGKSQLATATHTQTTPAGGVPVPITAGLCLLSFLLAYFLF
jgi:hypothetical protein